MVLEYLEGLIRSYHSAVHMGNVYLVEDAEFSVFNITLSYFQLSKHRDALEILARIFKGYGNLN